jgi:hypothetical protein
VAVSVGVGKALHQRLAAIVALSVAIAEPRKARRGHAPALLADRHAPRQVAGLVRFPGFVRDPIAVIVAAIADLGHADRIRAIRADVCGDS